MARGRPGATEPSRAMVCLHGGERDVSHPPIRQLDLLGIGQISAERGCGIPKPAFPTAQRDRNGAIDHHPRGPLHYDGRSIVVSHLPFTCGTVSKPTLTPSAAAEAAAVA